MQSFTFSDNDNRVENLHNGPDRDDDSDGEDADDSDAALPRARDAETQEAEAESKTSTAAVMQLCCIPVTWQIFWSRQTAYTRGVLEQPLSNAKELYQISD